MKAFKSGFLALALIAVLFSSCSKEQRLNRKLDGTWSVTSIDGNAMSSGESITMTFSKDKKGRGDFVMNFTDPIFGNSTEQGDYKLTTDEQLSFFYTDGAVDVVRITDYSKEDLTFLTESDDTYILKKN
jgi:hypothetical protein